MKKLERVFKIEEIGEVVGEFLRVLGLGKKTRVVGRVSREGAREARALVVGFSGNLGSGKTTFTKEVLRQLGVLENVISPTFVLRRDYEFAGGRDAGKIIHIDAYRLEKPEHIWQIIEKNDLEDNKNLIILEWPEKVDRKILDTIFLFEHVDKNIRKISEHT